MMKKYILTFCMILALTGGAAAQEEPKTGFSFAGLPFAGYHPDKGFQTGAVVNVYDFRGEGTYPNPRQHIYADGSWYPQGAQRYTLGYDNRFLIPGIRFTFTAQFLNEKAHAFYGFGGYASYYDDALPTDYYRLSRKVPAAKLDFTGRIADHFYWKFGYHFKYFILDEVGTENLQQVPFAMSLFTWYKQLGFIEADEFAGGMVSAWRAGLCYDSRDAENSPTRGLWADAFMEWAPGWMGTNKPYGRYYAVLRQYFPLHGDRLVFAYRANVQGFLGKPAFYVLPWESMIGPGFDNGGFGGYNTLRGIMTDRIQGQAVCYFNTELRGRFYDTRILGQNLSLGANVFFEGGRVLKNYTDVSVDASLWSRHPEQIPEQLLKGGREGFHLSAGLGFRAMLNRNFIIAVDYGRAFNRQDNGRGGAIYVNTGYLF